MAQVIVREGENLENALKRFKRSCARDGVMAEVRKREHYEKPSVRRKKSLKPREKRLGVRNIGCYPGLSTNRGEINGLKRRTHERLQGSDEGSR